MEPGIEDGNAFAIPDLYKASSLAHFDSKTPELEILLPLRDDDDALRNDSKVKLPFFSEDLKSGLLDLPAFDYGPIEDVGVLEDSSVASLESLDGVDDVIGEKEEAHKDEHEDVWTSLPVSERHGQSTKVQSWEAVYGVCIQQPRTIFLSDAGAQVYDAAIIKSAESANPGSVDSIAGHVVQSDAILSSLTQLAMGRESVLYCYSEGEESFRPRKNDIRMSGYSLETFNSFSESLISHGNRVRHLRGYVAQTHRSPTVLSAQVSLAGALLPILTSMDAQIGCPLAPVCSLLQLQALLERPTQVLQCWNDVVAKVRGAQTEEELLSRVYELVQDAEHSPPWLLSTLQRLLATVSRPWLESVEEWVGLHQRRSFTFKPDLPAFVVMGQRDATGNGDFDTEANEFAIKPSAMPSFVSTEDASMIFETGKSLRLLGKHQPEHPLVKQAVLPFDVQLGLDWQFTWHDIENVTAKANEYERGLRKALKDFNSGISATAQAPCSSSSQIQESMHDVVDQPMQAAQVFPEVSSSAFEALLPELEPSLPFTSEDTNLEASNLFAPPLSLIPTLSFTPLISARARLINNATLRLLFKTHHLRVHLSLLHRFILLSDGIFTSRLSHALFSHDPPSTNPHLPRSSNPAGLNLGYRSTWPPASFELRLALSGILADSNYSSSSSNSNLSINRPPSSSSTNEDDNHPLPLSLSQSLSFAIRPMKPEVFTATCSNPNSLQALDFLRLQYTPPPPLDRIITSTSLAIYDRLFTFLLRCHRLQVVVTQLFALTLSSSTTNTDIGTGTGADTTQHHRRHRQQHITPPSWTRFRWEAHCFVSCVCSWAFEDCVAVRWRVFEVEVERIATAAAALYDDNDNTRAGGKGDGESESSLRDLHARFVDGLSDALLLSFPQQKLERKLKAGEDKGGEEMSAMLQLEEILGLVLKFGWLVHRADDGGEGEGRKTEAEAELEKEILNLHTSFSNKVRGLVEMCRADGQDGGGKAVGREAGRKSIVALGERLDVSFGWLSGVG